MATMTKAAGTTAAAQKNNTETSMSDTAPLKRFFIDALRDMLWAENAVMTGLQKMKQSATCEQLIDAFEDHEFQTRKHISRLERVFSFIDASAEPKKCKAMEGILKEVDEIIESTPEGSSTRDATLIIAAQKVIHYEIASYGGLVEIALTIKEHKAADLLQKTLDEEEDIDHRLTEIAESHINFEAGAEEESGMSANAGKSSKQHEEA